MAEIGTSHGGDLSRAADLISAAVEAGADCVKFQMVYADEIVHAKTGDVPLPGGSIPLYERFRSLERPIEFYQRVKELADGAGVEFLCTPFGIRSALALRTMAVQRMKVASPELNHIPLLTYLANENMPLILSTGVSMLADIEEALAITGIDKVTILHCVTAYPAPPTEYNLRLLPVLAQLFGVEIGVSDHSVDPRLVPVLAISQGASVIEKHITLSRSGDGLDDPVALEPVSFRSMVDAVREAEQLPGREVIRRMTDLFGGELVQSVLGHGRKVLAPSERLNYGRTNRSLHATRELKKGAVIEEKDVAILRTEKVLRPGLHPRFLPLVIGRRLAEDVPAGEGITWDCMVPRA